jgi:hypothetical protein
MIARAMHRTLRRMDRIAATLDKPEVRGTQMNLTWLHWMGEFSEAMNALPRPAYDLLANCEGDGRPYVEMLPVLIAATHSAASAKEPANV